MNDTFPKEIGRYKILKRIGKGGMGEVFLAYDPVCERNVALKCIRKDLQEKKMIRSRFLREARIAAQLTHPSIVPIYSVHAEATYLYYTMCFVDGETLRKILRDTKEAEQKTGQIHPIGGSIPTLCQMFMKICEAVAYTHSKTVLHRDLKPENIIIGKYGEVMILDWGIADFARVQKKGSKTGKVAGTVAYMAPERALGEKANYQTDIYSLGVILYQILTLELPFQRGNLQAFRKYLSEEKYIDPIEIAPYREIPHELLDIVKKSLSFHPENRYHTMEELIYDMQNAMQGKPYWMLVTKLDTQKADDWEFQENIMIAKHTAITRHTDIVEWAALMVSKHNFSGNIRIEVSLELSSESAGIGIIFGVPESARRQSLQEGYCLWVSSDPCKVQLFRSNVLVIDHSMEQAPEKKQHIIIEKSHEHIRCFFQNTQIFTYTSSLPLTGAHVGILHQDTEFHIHDFSIYSGSQSLMVNCLAIPDAFFACQDYDAALLEYRRIGRAFPGRAEGRDALFKAGITLLEKAKSEKSHTNSLYLQALDEFELLHSTPGAPLEYLGKALTYKELEDYDEEAKCLEFALKKFAKHPLLPILEEHIVFRMHESTAYSRKAAYKIILLVVRYFPQTLRGKEAKVLIASLETHWQELFFIEKQEAHPVTLLAIILSFWTDSKASLLEVIASLKKKHPIGHTNLENALFGLSELGYYSDVRAILDTMRSLSTNPFLKRGLSLIKCTILKDNAAIQTVFSKTENGLDKKQIRVLIHLIKKLLLRREYGKIQQIFSRIPPSLDTKEGAFLYAGFLWSFLLENNIPMASKIVQQYKKNALENDNLPIFSAYGVFLHQTKGKKAMQQHFSLSLDRPFPPTSSLLGKFLQQKIDDKAEWGSNAFYWEKQELFLELTLFYRVTKQEVEAKKYERLLEGRYTRDYRKDLRS